MPFDRHQRAACWRLVHSLEALGHHATSWGVNPTQLLYLTALAAVSVVSGCAHRAAPLPKLEAAQAADQEPVATPAEAQAQARYNKGIQTLRRGLYQDAISHFEAVRTEHPYSRFAALSELRIADAHMDRHQHLEAIDAYRAFLRFHPTHPEAAYALGRVGEAYYAQIPRDFWLMPPSEEKDLGHVKEAITAYEDLLARYPAAQSSAQAQTHLAAARRKLADHEMYVARFYFARRQWAGAEGRLLGLLKQYTDLGLDAEALWLLAQAQKNQGRCEHALASVTRLLADYGDTQQGRRAQRLLEQLEGASP